MKILSIETSCDETSVAVVEDGRKILTNRIYSQIDIHKKYGGVVPEIASRNHVMKLPYMIEEARFRTAVSDPGGLRRTQPSGHGARLPDL